jgi:hypothetical protein
MASDITYPRYGVVERRLPTSRLGRVGGQRGKIEVGTGNLDGQPVLATAERGENAGGKLNTKYDCNAYKACDSCVLVVASEPVARARAGRTVVVGPSVNPRIKSTNLKV